MAVGGVEVLEIIQRGLIGHSKEQRRQVILMDRESGGHNRQKNAEQKTDAEDQRHVSAFHFFFGHIGRFHPSGTEYFRVIPYKANDHRNDRSS